MTKLRASRLRTTKWLLLFAPLLWTPLAMVGARGLMKLDLYRSGGLWLAGNLAAGVVAIVVIVWIARRYTDALGRSRFLQRLADDVVGRSLITATAFLDEIARFEEK